MRPWQFVLDPLNGYLVLAEKLWHNGPDYVGAWNFGPSDTDAKDVACVVQQLARAWGVEGDWRQRDGAHPHEAGYLRLDSTKARSQLSWDPVLDLQTTLEWIVDWHKHHLRDNNARDITLAQISEFQRRATA